MSLSNISSLPQKHNNNSNNSYNSPPVNLEELDEYQLEEWHRTHPIGVQGEANNQLPFDDFQLPFDDFQLPFDDFQLPFADLYSCIKENYIELENIPTGQETQLAPLAPATAAEPVVKLKQSYKTFVATKNCGIKHPVDLVLYSLVASSKSGLTYDCLKDRLGVRIDKTLKRLTALTAVVKRDNLWTAEQLPVDWFIPCDNKFSTCWQSRLCYFYIYRVGSQSLFRSFNDDAVLSRMLNLVAYQNWKKRRGAAADYVLSVAGVAASCCVSPRSVLRVIEKYNGTAVLSGDLQRGSKGKRRAATISKTQINLSVQ